MGDVEKDLELFVIILDNLLERKKLLMKAKSDAQKKIELKKSQNDSLKKEIFQLKNELKELNRKMKTIPDQKQQKELETLSNKLKTVQEQNITLLEQINEQKEIQEHIKTKLSQVGGSNQRTSKISFLRQTLHEELQELILKKADPHILREKEKQIQACERLNL